LTRKANEKKFSAHIFNSYWFCKKSG
jgi:hypothetical protein